MITVFCIQKGGSSKTTTTVCSAHTLATVYNKDVLVLDLDSQSNATCSFGFENPEEIDNTILDVLRGIKDINECIYQTNFGVDLIPSNKFLSGFVVEALTNQNVYGNPVYILKNKLQMLSKSYSHILIDLPPELGIFTISGMIAADNIVIPAQTEFRSIRGLEILLETIDSVKHLHNPKLEILGILPTMFNASTNLCTTVLQDIRKKFDGEVRVFDTVIPRIIRLAEADYFYEPATYRYKEDKKVQSYLDFVKEAFING